VRERLLSALVFVAAAACTDGEMSPLGSGDDIEEAPVELLPARGLEIVAVEVNQGMAVTIDEGGWIDPAERPRALIAGREALVRVLHRVDPDWIGRDIEARLTIAVGGTSETLFAVRTIVGDADPSDLDTTFSFELDASQTSPDAQYRLELWETGEAPADALERTWASPREGMAVIGFDAQPLVIKVLFVPLLAADTSIEPSTPLDLDPLVDSLYEQNPTNAIETSVREPIVLDGAVSDLSELLTILGEQRAADAVADDVYYHGIFVHDAPSLGGRQGMANIVGPLPGDGPMRVGVTVYWAPDPSLAAATFNHEIGHNQGLQHVMCPSAEADGLAVDYPHINGWIGEWGWGLLRRELFAPDDAYDYMSYCEPSWVSDWTWAHTYERIAALTGYADGMPNKPNQPSEQGWLLIGAPRGQGMHWWVAPGRVDPARVHGGERVELELDAGEQVELPLARVEQSEGGPGWWIAELPDAFERRVVAARHRDAKGQLHAIPRERVASPD
jgi:hypothetical protein